MILLTGASGFIGRALTDILMSRGVRVVLRQPLPCPLPLHVESVYADYSKNQDWHYALLGVQVIVHCAARVHVLNERSANILKEFRSANVESTLNLAKQAARAGVRRFVFISSIKVNGERTEPGKPFFADTPPDPRDPYGVSKAEAEEGLFKLAEETGMEVTVIRPPLVYGPGVKANFQVMMKWLERGIPLPFGAIRNARSLVNIDNLVNLIVICADHPAAANQIFLVSDGEDLSTTDLLLRMGQALSSPARLIPVPQQLLTIGASVLGKQGVAQRLCGSLQVDIAKTREVLGWMPPVNVDEGLRRTAEQWLKVRARLDC